MNITLKEALNILHNEPCPHQRRIACSTCEKEMLCAAEQLVINTVEYDMPEKLKQYEDIFDNPAQAQYILEEYRKYKKADSEGRLEIITHEQKEARDYLRNYIADDSFFDDEYC